MFAEWTTLSGKKPPPPGPDPTRLAGRRVRRRQQRWGENTLWGSRLSLLALLLNQFKDFMVLVLLGATLLSALLGEYSDALTIIVIVLINAVLGLVQEYRAERSLAALKKLAAPRARVLRSGEIMLIPAREVVPGDLVYLEAGDRVSVDLRLLSTQSLTINEAALTGEAEAVLKRSAPLPTAAGTPGDAYNMAFSGTEVLTGRGQGVAVATGMNTEIGQIAHLMESADQTATPLQQRLERLGRSWWPPASIAWVSVCWGGAGRALYAMFMAGSAWPWRPSRRAAGHRYRIPGPGGAAHDPPPRHRPPPAGGGDPGLGIGNLLR